MSNGVIYNLRKEGEVREIPVYGIDGLRNIAEVVGGRIVSDKNGTHLNGGSLRYVLVSGRKNLEERE